MTKKGVKIQNFKKSKKVPLDVSEIHVVPKFGPIPMQIATGNLSDKDHNTMEFLVPLHNQAWICADNGGNVFFKLPNIHL